jgi:hypothetical protein
VWSARPSSTMARQAHIRSVKASVASVCLVGKWRYRVAGPTPARAAGCCGLPDPFGLRRSMRSADVLSFHGLICLATSTRLAPNDPGFSFRAS